MKKVFSFIVAFAGISILSTALAQDKGATKSNTKIKVRTQSSTGKDDNCYLNGNGGTTPPAPGSGTTVIDSTAARGASTTVIPVPKEAVDKSKKKMKNAGKSLINGAGGKLKFP